MNLAQGDSVESIELSRHEDVVTLVVDVDHLGMQALYLLVQLIQLGAALAERTLGQEDLLCLYVGSVVAEGNKVCALAKCVDGDGKVLVLPLLDKEFAAAAVEVHIEAGVAHGALYVLALELAPWLEHLDILLHLFYCVARTQLLALYLLDAVEKGQGGGLVGSDSLWQLYAFVVLGIILDSLYALAEACLECCSVLKLVAGGTLLQLLDVNYSNLTK